MVCFLGDCLFVCLPHWKIQWINRTQALVGKPMVFPVLITTLLGFPIPWIHQSIGKIHKTTIYIYIHIHTYIYIYIHIYIYIYIYYIYIYISYPFNHGSVISLNNSGPVPSRPVTLWFGAAYGLHAAIAPRTCDVFLTGLMVETPIVHLIFIYIIMII